jgi:uncharacterized protein with GYD domain
LRVQEDVMAHYLLRWQFSTETAKSFVAKPQDRARPAHAFIESFGGRMQSYYFALGEYDGVGIVEFPVVESVAALSMLASSTGAFARFESTQLLTSQEAEAAMKKAHAKAGTYKAPNA